MAKAATTKPQVDDDTIDRCLAHAVATGDIVNFRFLFMAASPLRDGSSEDIAATKYAYLLPEDKENPHFHEALELACQPEISGHVRAQLERKGPAQLPWQLVLMLADHAVRLGKYTAAAQAYELLRVRRRMREEFLAQGDAALADGDLGKGLRAYLIGTGLEYDYAAFPEPLPVVPDFPSRALLVHAEYPRSAEDCVALYPEEAHIKAALAYLLCSPDAAARLDARPLDQRLDFLEALVRQRDPEWGAFAERYLAACDLMTAFAGRIEREANRKEGVETSLEDEVSEQEDDLEPREIPAKLLGRAIEDGEWWQYLKELAYQHPPAILFVSRQVVAKDVELILPRYRKDSSLVKRLGLEAG